MADLRLTVRTMWSLGIASLLRVAWYRAGLKTGLNGVKQLASTPVSGLFFRAPMLPPTGTQTNEGWKDRALLFGWAEFDLGGKPPPWHVNLFNGAVVANGAQPWWEIPDFDPALGDIKTVWELSRFDWVVVNASRAREGDAASLERLNTWLSDWVAANPCYRGPNWKCGQEASIRVIHMALAALILDQEHTPEIGLRTLIGNHLRRIAPTMSYAIGQNNNHGTSEAAALFIGGSWLASMGRAEGLKWARTGRRVLENRAAALIAEDGSFSQYSLVYHRLMLDTLSAVELWRRRLSLPPFSEKFRSRAKAATLWLHAFVDPDTGAVPNLGANDGAQLIPIGNRPARDFRPSLQLAAVLHADALAMKSPHSCDQLCRNFRTELPSSVLPAPTSRVFEEGGFVAARRANAAVFMRFPRFKFRPSQCDALHVDLWVDGEGLLRDAGSFSYASDFETSAYFTGTAGHNTIMFDARDQMPRIGRFLFGDWLTTRSIPRLDEEPGHLSFSASYAARYGPVHERTVSLSDNQIAISDCISGFSQNAVMRWRLPAGDWCIDGQTLTTERYEMTIDATMPINRVEIVVGYESLHYHQKSACQVLEVEVQSAGSLTTVFAWRKRMS